MLLYGCFNIDIGGPLTEYLKTSPKFPRDAELQTLRASPKLNTLSRKRAVSVSVALMQMRRREAGQGGGWGCGPEQLTATVPCTLWMYRNGQAHTAFSRVL
jgi:hypothetical protein